ncbi:HisA/HisF-related TIM barrel protein [Streptomyces melanogenes]|uniref:HisA/HisF-related TIM barrel protein n=1 Tax=Streptomyces melanogenes TaxID=67326 RepID=UPI00378CD5EB
MGGGHGARRSGLCPLRGHRCRPGTLTSPNTGLFTQVCARSTAGVLAAGGIASLDDPRTVAGLAPHGVEGVLIGRALFAGAFTLTEALAGTATGERSGGR